jgi:hypothetical protein
MARIPYAARVLTDEVTASDPKASGKYMDEDGLGVYRTVKFSKAVSRWLQPALEFLADARVAKLHTEQGNLLVTLSPRSPLADDRSPWMVDLVRRMQAPDEGVHSVNTQEVTGGEPETTSHGGGETPDGPAPAETADQGADSPPDPAETESE